MLLMRQLFAYYFPQKCSFTLFEVVILVKISCTVNDNFRLIFVGVYHEIVALAADSCLLYQSYQLATAADRLVCTMAGRMCLLWKKFN